MNRRQYLALSATVAVAGCGKQIQDRGQPPTPPPLPEVTLTATDTEPENPEVALKVVYNSRSQMRIPVDEPLSADSGMKWLVVRADVTNQTDKTRDLQANQYVVLTEGNTYQFKLTLADWELTTKQAAPGETVTGWLAFQIPGLATEATLTVKESLADNYAILFSHDSSLDAAIPE
jgi:hypothetical protein